MAPELGHQGQGARGDDWRGYTPCFVNNASSLGFHVVHGAGSSWGHSDGGTDATQEGFASEPRPCTLVKTITLGVRVSACGSGEI